MGDVPKRGDSSHSQQEKVKDPAKYLNNKMGPTFSSRPLRYSFRLALRSNRQ